MLYKSELFVLTVIVTDAIIHLIFRIPVNRISGTSLEGTALDIEIFCIRGAANFSEAARRIM